MTWYRTGSADVTQNGTAVAGSGTDWSGNVRPGDVFRGPDGVPLEIATVDGATALTLAEPYGGVTAAGAAYAVIPTDDTRRDQTAAVAQLIADVSTPLDGALAGRFGDGTVALPGIGFDADPDSGLWRVAANTIALVTGGVERARVSSTGLSVTGLLTGSAVQSGPLDATTGRVLTVGAAGLLIDQPETVTDPDNAPAGSTVRISGSAKMPDLGSWVLETAGFAASTGSRVQEARRVAATREVHVRQHDGTSWSGWAELFSTENALGTVSLDGGVPTGALFERSATASGTTRITTDGTQVCSHSATLSYVTTGYLGATWVFPQPFAAAPSAIHVTPDFNSFSLGATPNTPDIAAAGYTNETATQVELRIYRRSGGTDFQPGDTCIVSVSAEGEMGA